MAHARTRALSIALVTAIAAATLVAPIAEGRADTIDATTRAGGTAMQSAAWISAAASRLSGRASTVVCVAGEPGCLGEERCLAHGLWHALGVHIAAFLASVSLQDLLDGIPSSMAPAREEAAKRMWAAQ